MRLRPRSPLLFIVFCSLAGLSLEAQAYLDPSTGSMILSAVVGLIATLGLAVKTYWYKLKNLVNRRPPADAAGSARQPFSPPQESGKAGAAGESAPQDGHRS